MFRYHALGGVSVVAIQVALFASGGVANAQSGEEKALPPVTVDAPSAAKRAARRPADRTAAVRRQNQPAAAAPERQLPVVVVDNPGAGANASFGTPPAVARFQLPQESFSITAKQIDETINFKDPEDAVKYMPSLFVRKRNDGDNQAVLATRSWGLNSSARTLIYYDDLLISALIGNNNSGASPKWNLISPEAIGRIDFLNGPFSAAYPGNSIGGVLLITSKMPDKPFAVAKETVSIMPWSQYGTQGHLCQQPDQRGSGRSQGAAVMAGQRQLPGHVPTAVDVYDVWHRCPAGSSKYDGNLSGIDQAGCDRERGRHRRIGAFATNLHQPQARL